MDIHGGFKLLAKVLMEFPALKPSGNLMAGFTTGQLENYFSRTHRSAPNNPRQSYRRLTSAGQSSKLLSIKLFVLQSRKFLLIIFHANDLCFEF